MKRFDLPYLDNCIISSNVLAYGYTQDCAKIKNFLSTIIIVLSREKKNKFHPVLILLQIVSYIGLKISCYCTVYIFP